MKNRILDKLLNKISLSEFRLMIVKFNKIIIFY